MTTHLTPALHDLAVSVAAPAIVLSGADGQIGFSGVTGWFVDDVRLLHELAVSVRGSDLELVRSAVLGADRQEFTYVARRLGGWLHDPTVTVDRRRTLTAAHLVEEIEVVSRSQETVALTLYVDLAVDLAPMATVRQGLPTEGHGVAGERTPDGVAWRRDGRGCTVVLDPAPDDVDEGRRVGWTATLEPRTSFVVRLELEATTPRPSVPEARLRGARRSRPLTPACSGWWPRARRTSPGCCCATRGTPSLRPAARGS